MSTLFTETKSGRLTIPFPSWRKVFGIYMAEGQTSVKMVRLHDAANVIHYDMQAEYLERTVIGRATMMTLFRDDEGLKVDTIPSLSWSLGVWHDPCDFIKILFVCEHIDNEYFQY
jgi:hypothetical protein